MSPEILPCIYQGIVSDPVSCRVTRFLIVLIVELQLKKLMFKTSRRKKFTFAITNLNGENHCILYIYGIVC